VTDYLCVTLLGQSGETQSAFKARLTAFWTHMLRNRPDDYERVYAEATAFGDHEGRPSRQYMVEVAGADVLVNELRAANLDFLPIDEDDTYSKYEATSPDWFQIEH
jgi:hypothetical protein